MFQRLIQKLIDNSLFKGKIIVILGARQTGKTTLLKEYNKKYSDIPNIYLNCDEPDIRNLLTNRTSTELNSILGSKKLIFIDEAQRIENIGITLKLLIDNYPDKQIIATGSSAFELSNKINEPLTGRKYEYYLFPFSISEIKMQIGEIEANRLLEQFVIYGLYPDVVTKKDEARTILLNLTNGYMYKDIFQWQQIRKPELIDKLLKALALQIGSEVSYNELANLLGVSKDTIASYLQLLEKTFVIFRLGSFRRNLRSELNKKQKFYFWDTGIRNAIIGNFSPLDLRTDTGHLWKNFIIAERLKRNNYLQNYSKSYFWRTTQQQEIDYIEEIDGNLSAFEIKWNLAKKYHFSKTFTNSYSAAKTDIITPENYRDFLF